MHILLYSDLTCLYTIMNNCATLNFISEYCCYDGSRKLTGLSIATFVISLQQWPGYRNHFYDWNGVCNMQLNTLDASHNSQVTSKYSFYYVDYQNTHNHQTRFWYMEDNAWKIIKIEKYRVKTVRCILNQWWQKTYCKLEFTLLCEKG